MLGIDITRYQPPDCAPSSELEAVQEKLDPLVEASRQFVSAWEDDTPDLDDVTRNELLHIMSELETVLRGGPNG